MKRSGFTLVEAAVAAGIGLVVLLGALAFQHHAATEMDTSRRKIDASGSTAFAAERIRKLAGTARHVWMAGPALRADGHELRIDTARGFLVVDGAPETACTLTGGAFAIDKGELLYTLTSDCSGQKGLRERSTLIGRLWLRPQDDARAWSQFPEDPHQWCQQGTPIRFGVIR